MYDIATNSWNVTGTLQANGVTPGFSAYDVWGVSMTSDAAHHQVFVTGRERNRNFYAYDAPSGVWTLGPTAIYDGGWGSSLEYVAASQKVYQIDGRNTDGTPPGSAPQGTAALYVGCPRPIANAGPDQTLPGSCSALTSVTLTGSVHTNRPSCLICQVAE